MRQSGPEETDEAPLARRRGLHVPVVVIRIGPSRSGRDAEGVKVARRHGLVPVRTAEGHVLTVDLDGTAGQLAALWAVLDRVRVLRGTVVEVDGEPEPAWLTQAMAYCARQWVRVLGACGERFPGRPWDRCFLCPLFDPERVGATVPDFVPEGWG